MEHDEGGAAEVEEEEDLGGTSRKEENVGVDIGAAERRAAD